MAKKQDGSRGDAIKLTPYRDPIRGAQKAEFFSIGEKSQDISKKVDAEQARTANPSGRK